MVSIASRRLLDCVSLSIMLSHINMHKDSKPKNKHPETYLCRQCSQVFTHPRAQPDAADAKVKKRKLSSCEAQIKAPSLSLLPRLHIHGICSALINHGKGGKEAATWNKALWSHGVLCTASWHLVVFFFFFFFLFCVCVCLTQLSSRLHRLLVVFFFFLCTFHITGSTWVQYHLFGDFTLWLSGKHEGC